MTLPKTPEALMAAARAMEREAAVCYDRLADEMARHGNRELAALFTDLAAEERAHEARIGRRSGRGDVGEAPVPPTWRAPEATDRTAGAEAGGPWLMTSYRALCLAVANEERAFAFFSAAAADAADRSLREMAEALAREELEHIVRLRLERRRAWRAESRAREGEGSGAVRSLADLLCRAHAIECASARRYEASERAAAGGEEAVGAVFRSLAAEQRRHLADLARRAEGAGVRLPTAPVSPSAATGETRGSALRLALADAGRAFDFYASVAERGVDQEVVAEAQRLAGHALDRLTRIRGWMTARGEASA